MFEHTFSLNWNNIQEDAKQTLLAERGSKPNMCISKVAQSQEHVSFFWGSNREQISTLSLPKQNLDQILPSTAAWHVFFLLLQLLDCYNDNTHTGALGIHRNSTLGVLAASFSELTWFQVGFPAAGGRTQQRKVAGPRQSADVEPQLAACSASPAPGCTETQLSNRWSWHPHPRTIPLSQQVSCPFAVGRKVRKRASVPFPCFQTRSCPPGEHKHMNKTPEHQHLQQWKKQNCPQRSITKYIDVRQTCFCEQNVSPFLFCTTFADLYELEFEFERHFKRYLYIKKYFNTFLFKSLKQCKIIAKVTDRDESWIIENKK